MTTFTIAQNYELKIFLLTRSGYRGSFQTQGIFFLITQNPCTSKIPFPDPKKNSGLGDGVQPGLSSAQVKFALGLKRPTITLTLVQTPFERQGKFSNFYEVYEHFRKIILFLVIY